MNKKRLSIFILILAIVVFSMAIGSVARAQEETQGEGVAADLQFPIVELGNCQSWGDCEIYCDKTENADACLAFGEANNLMTEEEVVAAKKFKEIGMIGPGNCKGKDECEKYCDNKDNMETCVSFAEEKGLMSGENLQEAKKVLTAVKSGVKPLGCNSRQECDDYCASSEHMEECLNFGVEAGILPAQEQTNARKVLTAIKNGAVRPACRGHECEVYCREGSEHAAECGKFAMEAGILSPPKMRQIQKMLTAIEEGVTLPSCGSEEECQDYCSQGANFEECVKFAEATGIMTSEEAGAARKTGGEGPGGCKTKEECDTFCNNSDNSEACFNFAKDNGLISEQDQKNIQNSQQQIKESFNNMPEEALTCLTSSLGVETIEKLKSGNAMPGKKMAEKMETCLGKPGEQPTPPEAPEQPGQPGENQGGGEQGQGGAGPGNGAGQGNGGPNQGQGFNPGSGQGGGQSQNTNPNPVKCIEDCEYVGKTCVGQAGEKSNACLSKGTYCRTVTCETFGAGGTRPTTQEEWNRCASYCRTIEDNCYTEISPTDDDCRTTKDVCVMNCQKASKPTKPTQPGQPGQPGQQPSQPSQPSQPGQPGQQPSQPSQPTPPTTGKCGDGICGRMERADPTLCPQDCGGSSQPSQPSQPGQPGQQPSQPAPPSPPSPPSGPGQPGQQPTPPSPPSPPEQPN